MPTEISFYGGGTTSRGEGNSGSAPFSFLLSRTGDTAGVSSVTYMVDVAGGTANAADFVGGVLPTGTVTFAAGETGQTVFIPVQGDAISEADETFTLRITNPVGATLTKGGDSLQYTIINDDDAGAQLGVLTLSGPGNIAEDVYSAIYTVTRTSTADSASYNWNMTGRPASPISGADFANGQLPSGVLNFPEGVASRSFGIMVPIDGVPEPVEQFALTITSVSGLINYATLIGNVKDTTFPASTVSISGPGSKNEGSAGTTTFDFVVNRTGDLSGTGSVNYRTNDSGATASDFVGGVLPSGVVTFGPGEASKTISIGVVGDTIFEGDEVFSVALHNVVNMNLGANDAAPATIINDDPSHYISDMTGGKPRLEGSTFTVTLTRADVSRPYSYTYEVTANANPSANGSDFVGGVFPAGTVYFAVGEAIKVFSFSTAGDTIVEGNESFSIWIRDAQGTGLASWGTWIIDDDGVTLPLPRMKVTSLSSGGVEGNAGSTPFVFTIEREMIVDSPSEVPWPFEVGETTVTYTVMGTTGVTGAAVSADDFVGGVLPSGTVTFAPGEAIKSVTVNVVGDTKAELDEAFILTLSRGGTLGIASAVAIIQNDDKGTDPTKPTPPAAVTPKTPAAQTLFTAWSNILNAAPNDTRATQLNAYGDLIGLNQSGSKAALDFVINEADGTTSVATLAYQFFTGKIPSQGGMTYLVSPTGPNANNLNSAYYQSFSTENRYINFAVNLGKLGEGAPKFAAEYGGLDLAAATTKAYTAIFGTAPTAEKVQQLLTPSFTVGGRTMTRADYFAYYGGDGANGIGTKAAMVGWLLAEAEKADIGMYSKANHAFLTDLADGAAYAVDLIGTYGQPGFAL